MAHPVLILPGIGNSGPQHWQTLWEQAHPGELTRVQQRDWDHPVRDEWVAALEAAARRAGPDVVLAAHSLACLVVAHWAAGSHAPIRAALLVAVPDPRGPAFPPESIGFSDPPARPFSFRSTVVVSDDDPYGSPGYSERLAAAWGTRIVHVGRCGHINSASGVGTWTRGWELLTELRR